MIPIVIPAFNEAANVASVVKAFRDAKGPEIAVYVAVDPETTDHTAIVAGQAGAFLLKPDHHGKGQVINHALSIVGKIGAREVVFCDADVTISPAAVDELLLPLGKNSGQRIIIPKWPTATQWDEATQMAGLKFNPDAWPLVSGIRRVRCECIPDGLYGYVMETQINRSVAEHGYTTEKMYSADTISPLRFTPRRVADLLANGKYAKEHGLL
jgi:glycosyltransferase involved in cell wall biosynthesis